MKWILALPVLALSLGLARPAKAFAALPAKAAPQFERNDFQGRKVSLSSYRGKVVVLNFWATWCAPCLAEMPRFVEWQKAYADKGLQIIGISMDDEAVSAKKMEQKLHLNYPVVMGDEKIGDAYGGVLGLPITIIVDPFGKIRYRHQGVTDLKQIEKEFSSLLAKH